MEKPYHILRLYRQRLPLTAGRMYLEAASKANRPCYQRKLCWYAQLGKQPSRFYYDGNRRGNGLPAYR